MQYRTSETPRSAPSAWAAMPLSIERRPDESAGHRHHPRRARRRASRSSTPPTATTWHAGEVGHNELARSPTPWPATAGTPRTSSSPPRAAACRPGDGSWTVTATPAHLKRPPTRRSSGSASRRSACTSSTARTRRCPRPSRSARCASSWTPARSALAGISNVNPDQIREAQADARRADSSRSRTSTRRPSAQSSPSCSCARSWAWRSCRGARSAASAGVRARPTPTARFQRIATTHGVSPQQVALAWLLSPLPGGDPGAGSQSPGLHPGLGSGRGTQAELGGAGTA